VSSVTRFISRGLRRGRLAALRASGARFQLQAFGVEAQRMLRLEKGHIIVGQDTDGVTNALEIEVSWALRTDKPFFIGQRSLAILQKQPRRQSLVGFSLPPEAPLPRESHLVLSAGRSRAASRAPAGRRRSRVASVWRW